MTPTRYAATVSDPRPWTSFSGERGAQHSYTDDRGNRGIIRVIPRGEHLHVDWVGPEGVSPGQVRHTSGFENMRSVGTQLAAHYPGAKYFTGIRTGGAFVGKPTRIVRPIPGRLPKMVLRREGTPKQYATRKPRFDVNPEKFPGETLPAYFQSIYQSNNRVRKNDNHATLSDALEGIANTSSSHRPNILAVYPDRSKLAVFEPWSMVVNPTGRFVPIHSSRGTHANPMGGQAAEAHASIHHRTIRRLLDAADQFGYGFGIRKKMPLWIVADAEKLQQVHPIIKGALDSLDPTGILAATDRAEELGVDNFPIENSRRYMEELSRHVGELRQQREQMSRRGLPRRLAKIDGDVRAHPLIASFPLEYFLRHLANDPANSGNVRDLAKVALTGGEKGPDGPGSPESLWMLADALDEHPNADGSIGHPKANHYNLRSAADKIRLDSHTYEALRRSGDDLRRIQGHTNYSGAADPIQFSPEYHAVMATSALDGRPATPYHRQVLDALRNHVLGLVGDVPEKDIDESIRRHATRAKIVWSHRGDSPETAREHRERALVDPRKTTEFQRDNLKNELAARYRRRYALNARGDFIDSLRRVRSRQQQAFRTAAKQVAAKLGLDPTHTIDSLHDSPQGATPGVAQAVYGAASPEAVQGAAAYLAMINNQTGFGVFHVRPGGVDLLHRFRHSGSGLELRHHLDRAGVTNRVLVPHRTGFDVLVPDPGGRLLPTLAEFTRVRGTQLQTSPGFFKVVGDADQSRAREMFRGTVGKLQRPRRYNRPESGRLTPDQMEILRQATDQGQMTAIGVLGDHLQENGFENAGSHLSATANSRPSDWGVTTLRHRGDPGDFAYTLSQSGELVLHSFRVFGADGRGYVVWRREKMQGRA